MSEFEIEKDKIYVNRLGVTIGPMIERRLGFEGYYVFAFANTTYTNGGFVLDEQHPVDEDLIREATSTEILANGFLRKLTEFISLPDEVMTKEMNQWLQHAREVIIGLSQDATAQMNEAVVPMPGGNGTPKYDAMPPLILDPDVSKKVMIPPAPMPAPTEWVELTDPDHVLRKSIDEIWAPKQKQWVPCYYSEGRTVGQYSESFEGSKFRCRIEHAPTPKPPLPDWPKFYVHRNPDARWYVRRNYDEKTEHHYEDHKETRAWHPYVDTFVASGDWLQVSEEEAMARIGRAKNEPVLKLTPLKKVVERLWIKKLSPSVYAERWIGYDEQPTDAGDWILTNRTREREIKTQS